MKREEEITRQAEKYSDNSSNYAVWSDDGGWSETNDIDLIEKAYKEGAKWANETMIDDVCKWLKDNIEEFVHGRDWELDMEDLTACLRVEIYEEV